MQIPLSSPRKRIALLVYTSFEPGRETLRGIAQFAHEIDSWRVLHVPGGYRDPIPDWLPDSGADGIIARVCDEEMASALQELNVPVVDVNRASHRAGIPQVDADDEAIAALVAEHVFDRGFRHVAFFPGDFAAEGWAQRRCESLRRLCVGKASYHVYAVPRKHVSGSTPARRHSRAWIRDLPKPVAIMVARDDGGLAVLDACREEGLLVPEQVAVIGVDNDQPLCGLCTPPLSSVCVDHFRVGYEAARLLYKLMAGAESPKATLLVPPKGIATRRSSDTRAIDDETVAASVHFIHENLANSKLTNDDLARAVGISRSLLQRRFRVETGKTIHEYIIEVRLKKAKALLRDSDLSLLEISNLVGFGRQGYMGHVFKTQLGITPGSFRNS